MQFSSAADPIEIAFPTSLIPYTDACQVGAVLQFTFDIDEETL
jgi:hypothetical protein